MRGRMSYARVFVVTMSIFASTALVAQVDPNLLLQPPEVRPPLNPRKMRGFGSEGARQQLRNWQ